MSAAPIRSAMSAPINAPMTAAAMKPTPRKNPMNVNPMSAALQAPR